MLWNVTEDFRHFLEIELAHFGFPDLCNFIESAVDDKCLWGVGRGIAERGWAVDRP